MFQETTPDGSTITRTLVVCLPADGGCWLPVAVEGLIGHTTPTPVTRFAVTRKGLISWIRSWTSRGLTGVRKQHGQIVAAAGGSLGRLDLTLTKHDAWYQAMLRHQTWQQAVDGTRVAREWASFLAAHEAKPEKYSRKQAWEDFRGQPRIVAMLVHNACGGPIDLDPLEIGLYQAGPEAYGRFCALREVCGDALVTDRAKVVRPADTSVTARLDYLKNAWQILSTLPTRQRLIALRLH
ncbi:hypothetical protein HDA40_002159 [Hamadaea flava]|uniref:Uncharacterized protein n=1 Tax=Hamadaea flava TaxID=1742688 RepID=A0ABV8LKC4_9ACTN|nr:hypothetical protein [Hamadaea flava]MCP2323652.1 hypothetical protein [Hamadaea flava]